MTLKVYVKGSIVDRDEALISVWDAGFQSGDAIWEGLRVYDGVGFRMKEHLTRLEHSARVMRITLPLTPDEIEDAIYATLSANDDFANGVHIRCMVTRGTRTLSGMDPRQAPEASLVIVPERREVLPDPTPLTLRTSSIRRPPPHVLDPSIHHANQLNSIMARLDVMDTGADAALMLDVDGFVSEADTANIFCVANEQVLTPIPRACLHGITRGIVMQLAADQGYTVAERSLSLFDFYAADEVFVTGTVCELVPVTRIDDRTVGGGEPGPVWRALLDGYRSQVRQEIRAGSGQVIAAPIPPDLAART